MAALNVQRQRAYEALCLSLRQFATDEQFAHIITYVVDMEFHGGSLSFDPAYYIWFNEIFPEPELPMQTALLRSAAFIHHEFVEKQSEQLFQPFVEMLTSAARTGDLSDPILQPWISKASK